NAASQSARALFAFDEQNGFPSYRCRCDGLLLCRHHGSGSNREKEPEFCPNSNVSAELDPTAMLLDGPIHTRQAKTCALAVLSSRAERFEQMSLEFRGDAAASVPNGKAHELCRSPSVCAACLRACLRNPLPLLLWRRGPGRGGRFLTRALR